MKAVLIEYEYYENKSPLSHFLNDDLYDFVDKRILVTNNNYLSIDKKTIILNHTNKGKDIGAKLIALDFLLNTKYDFDILLLLHDKKSPQSPMGDIWFKELTKIFNKKNLQILEKKLSKRNIGLCCAKKYIRSEFNHSTNLFETSNNLILKQLLKKYNLTNLKKYPFVAGTIFACKWQPYRDFFSKHPPLEIRASLELGNVQDNQFGTYTHSWERIFSWIIINQNQSIIGL